jgi:hypothetical protein
LEKIILVVVGFEPMTRRTEAGIVTDTEIEEIIEATVEVEPSMM